MTHLIKKYIFDIFYQKYSKNNLIDAMEKFYLQGLWFVAALLQVIPRPKGITTTNLEFLLTLYNTIIYNWKNKGDFCMVVYCNLQKGIICFLYISYYFKTYAMYIIKQIKYFLKNILNSAKLETIFWFCFLFFVSNYYVIYYYKQGVT